MRAIVSPKFLRRTLLSLFLAVACRAHAQAPDPEVGRLLERALQEAENFRKQLPTLQYNSTMNVQEWDGRGRLRGTAKATAIMRPGDAQHPVTFLTREVHGKVKLPDDKEKGKEDDKDNSTLQDFGREHHLAERFRFTLGASETLAGEPSRRVDYAPKEHQPEKNTADRFLDSIQGSAWVTEEKGRLTKFEMHLLHPFQLLWIFAVMKELSIEYELIKPRTNSSGTRS